ncbi:werner syndrome-like exonuclease, partial [Phtheirospermum japonicum]
PLTVGLDIEWRPSFKRYINNPAATLQLCVDRRCLIFQLIHASSIPKLLVDFPANPNHTFIGIGIDQNLNLEKLEEDYEFGFRTNTVDLRGLAADEVSRAVLRILFRRGKKADRVWICDGV